MRTSKREYLNLMDRLRALGFTLDEAESLIGIERTLRRWGEMECGNSNDHASWSIERDDETGKPFRCVYPHRGESYREPIADREAGAKKRLAKIMAGHPTLIAYHQSDPRGCALYIVRKADLPTDEFELVALPDGKWTIQRHGNNQPYSTALESERDAKDFAASQTLSSFYTRGIAVAA